MLQHKHWTCRLERQFLALLQYDIYLLGMNSVTQHLRWKSSYYLTETRTRQNSVVWWHREDFGKMRRKGKRSDPWDGNHKMCRLPPLFCCCVLPLTPPPPPLCALDYSPNIENLRIALRWEGFFWNLNGREESCNYQRSVSSLNCRPLGEQVRVGDCSST